MASSSGAKTAMRASHILSPCRFPTARRRVLKAVEAPVTGETGRGYLPEALIVRCDATSRLCGTEVKIQILSRSLESSTRLPDPPANLERAVRKEVG